jgi:hypothetical protein
MTTPRRSATPSKDDILPPHSYVPLVLFHPHHGAIVRVLDSAKLGVRQGSPAFD